MVRSPAATWADRTNGRSPTSNPFVYNTLGIGGSVKARSGPATARSPGARRAEGRWRCFEHKTLTRRDDLGLDVPWLRHISLEDSVGLPEPDVFVQEIADDLLASIERFAAIANELRGERHGAEGRGRGR